MLVALTILLIGISNSVAIRQREKDGSFSQPLIGVEKINQLPNTNKQTRENWKSGGLTQISFEDVLRFVKQADTILIAQESQPMIVCRYWFSFGINEPGRLRTNTVFAQSAFSGRLIITQRFIAGIARSPRRSP